MSDRIGSRWRSPWLRAQVPVGLALLTTLLGLAVAVPAHADLIILKDGFAIQGEVKREVTMEFDKEAKDMITIPKGFYFIDDLPRHIYFAPSLVRIVEPKKEIPNMVRAVNKKGVAFAKAYDIQAIEEILETGDWNDKWERTTTFRGRADGRYYPKVSVPQRLGFMNSYFARMEATERLKWSAFYMISELGLDNVKSLLNSHPDFKLTPDLKPEAKLARRFNYCDFFVQAGWFDEAEGELNRMLADTPDQKDRIEGTLKAIGHIRNRERLNEIKRQNQAGQYEKVRRRLEAFADKDVNEKVLAEIATLKSEDDSRQKKMAEALRHLNELPKLITDGHRQAFVDLIQELKTDVSPEGLPRLDTFLGQAAQAERQRNKGQTSLAPSELLSLAVTGWLLGSPSSEGRPERALQLWAARKMVLEYLREPSEDRRKTVLSTYLGRADKVPLDEIVQMIPYLPPPAPEAKVDAKANEVQLEGPKGAKPPAYVLQLPPEYRHSRSYPVLFVLHREGEKAQEMLERWSDLAALNGYILVAPRWEAGGLNGGGYGYSEREHGTVLASLHDLRRRFNIDSDRVFLFGLGQGANMAMDVGLSHPDLFAGVIPMGCNPEYFVQAYWRNGQFLPFYIVSGMKSGDNEKHIRILMEKWVQKWFPMLWVQYKGRGVEWFGGEQTNIMDWMRGKRRAFPMQQLGHPGLGQALDGNEFCTMRESDTHFFWLVGRGVHANCQNSAAGWRKLAEPAKMSGRIDPQSNEIYLTSVGLQQVTLLLGRNSRGENMIDFDKPVTVRINQQGRWLNQKIPPNLGVLLEELYQSGDRQRLFLAKLDFTMSR
jgi:pimeloyl-ACP methyl ester carboxylesterase